MKGFHRLRYPNGTVLEMTPWAARVLTPVQMDRIAYQLAPRGSTVVLGHGRGWTCRLIVDGVCVAEEFDHVTPTAAVKVAALAVGRRIDPDSDEAGTMYQGEDLYDEVPS